ncbi:hypothetical protein D7Z54_26820 [Salibacterium salarium]|uniref:Uncharacterized protein n=1 Tax=Salibacterium salarium TaxID=284579 RepID=A0A3R9P4L0_9BACI|nr:hypothetical protein [Salibacterium salarium]RSL30227.1 hypothetical protein D7Z54_26820 [Salibacterium salarium]
MDLFFTMVKDIISTFFQNGIWVVGFFYLLNKTFENQTLRNVSRDAIIVILALLLIYSIFFSI